MIKLCLIGDSHAGAIRAGVNWMRQQEGLPVTARCFFAHAKSWTGLSIENGAIRFEPDLARQLAKRSGGRATIDPALYDAFVIVGLHFGIGRVLTTAMTYRPPGTAPIAAARYLISEACFIESCVGQVGETPALIVAGLLRQICDKPILVVPNPLPSEAMTAKMAGSSHAVFPTTLANGDQAVLAALFSRVCAATEVAAKLTIVPQPAQTVRNGIFTAAQHAVLAEPTKELGDSEKLGRLLHMNEEFGTLATREVLIASGLLRHQLGNAAMGRGARQVPEKAGQGLHP